MNRVGAQNVFVLMVSGSIERNSMQSMKSWQQRLRMDVELTIEAVLEKELYTAPPLMPVAVAKIVGTKKDIPKAFSLTKNLSSDELKHLRRVRDIPNDSRLECIICKIKSISDTKQREEIQQLEAKFTSENIFTDYRIAHVPSYAPKTEHQLDKCGPIWPCKYAKCNYLIKCIEGSLLSDTEKLVIKIIADNLITHIRNESNKTETCAVVFRCAKIYGVGLSSSGRLDENPVKHSTMLAIDDVALKSGSGHWGLTTGQNLLNSIQEDLDRNDALKDHHIDKNFLPYLCTNYDILITEEPCFMCTMGLVQSRIRRLFYLDKESAEKIRGCKRICYPDRAIEEFLVHREKNLNHRFEAWRITINNL